jgi:ABC-type multidrug transport system ATPase subunit
MTTPEIELRSLRVARGERTVLDIPAARFEGGALNIVTGANGAGKTTLLLSCAGLMDLAGGEVLLGDEPFHRGRAPAPLGRRRRTSSSFQDPYFFSGSVRQNIEFGLRCRNLPRRERIERAERAAERLGLGPLLDRPASELSGGEKKRVDLARALAVEATCLFLDEPTLAVDDDSAQRFLRALAELLEKSASTILVATHELARFESLPHRVFAIESGRLRDTV